MIEFLPHFISGLALTVVGWVVKDRQSLRTTVHDLELRQVRTETQAQGFGVGMSKMAEDMGKMAENMATRHDLVTLQANVCQRIDDLRRS